MGRTFLQVRTDESDKVYCYPDSEVLVNKLNIRDIDRLHAAERRLKMLRLNDLLNKPIKEILI